MNIRFSLHSTLMSFIFCHHVIQYRHNIDFWQRSTEMYPHFYDLLSDRSGVKFRNIPVLRVWMSASSLSLFGALIPGLVIFNCQNDFFRRCLRPVPNVVLLPCRTQMKLSFRFKHGSSTPFETIKRGTAELGSARLLSTASLAVPHGSSTTWVQTACYCRAELNS